MKTKKIENTIYDLNILKTAVERISRYHNTKKYIQRLTLPETFPSEIFPF